MGYGDIDILGFDEILQTMVDIVVTETNLSDLLPAATLMQILSAAARSDETIYFQIAKLVDAFSLRRASGENLDLRLPDYDLSRGGAQFANSSGYFVRDGSTGDLDLPVGTEISTDQGVRFKTVTPAAIPNGNTLSGNTSLICLESGESGNVEVGTIKNVITVFAGPEAVGLRFYNDVPGSDGLEEESDQSAKQRAHDKIRSLNRTSPDALLAIARQIELDDGQSVAHANLIEPPNYPARIHLWVDNGTGYTEALEVIPSGTPEVLIASAVGGESRFQLENPPVYVSGGAPVITVRINSIAKVEGTDYHLNPGTGMIMLDETVYPSGLTTGDSMDADYTHHTGLIQETQWTIDGRTSDPETYIGGRAAGAQLRVLAPTIYLPVLELTVVVDTDFADATSDIKAEAQQAVINYVNSLDIGDDIILSKVTDIVDDIEGVFDVYFNTPAPSDPPANIAVTDDQIVRASESTVTIN
jgi:uncharacterized phage protein gp47/JayE